MSYYQLDTSTKPNTSIQARYHPASRLTAHTLSEFSNQRLKRKIRLHPPDLSNHALWTMNHTNHLPYFCNAPATMVLWVYYDELIEFGNKIKLILQSTKPLYNT